MNTTPLTAADIAALRSYAAEYGPKWKDALALDWYNARLSICSEMPERGSILHGLRNNLGPSWLADFRFAEPIKYPNLRKLTQHELSRLMLLSFDDLVIRYAIQRERRRRGSC
ncbi:MAG: hypothetical protein E5W82_10515 [Mesorhizobium sp.]|nr:MAG: hypothetical protein E5W82_10515 [Mesorhizobium sp.]